MNTIELTFRNEVEPADCKAVAEILKSSGFFYSYEVDVAIELIEDRLEKGEKSEYKFLFAEHNNKIVGYTCYVPIACTISSYDLYWIAVHNNYRNQGIGKILLKKTEEIAVKNGGTRMYIETSGRKQYEPTRIFYESCGYKEEARLKDFYAPGDDKIIEVKDLSVVN